MQINGKTICAGCMRRTAGSGQVCPYCGYNETTDRNPEYAQQPGTVLNGKYLIGKVLGIGGFAVTYLALDLRLLHPVAIKEYHYGGQRNTENQKTPNPGDKAGNRQAVPETIRRINKRRFEQEARILAAYSGLAGIVQVYDYFWENETAYITMEYLSGPTLRSFVKDKGPMSLPEAAMHLEPIMKSLQYLHHQGILHCDLSPDNIRIQNSTVHKGAFILYDFGCILLHPDHERRRQSKEKNRNVIFIKTGYTALEQMRGSSSIGPWTDLYALAATLYYCVTGEDPPDAAVRERKKNHTNHRMQERGISKQSGQRRQFGQYIHIKKSAATLRFSGDTRRRISGKQEKVLLKAMQLYPENRYASIDDFLQALKKAGLEERSAVRMRKGKHFAQALIVLCLLLTAFVLCSVLLLRGTDIYPKQVPRYAQNLQVGDTLCIGKCEQDADLENGEEAIEWIILKIDEVQKTAADGYSGRVALLVSRSSLMIKEFDNTDNGRKIDTALSWQSSTLRRVLTDTQSDEMIWPGKEFRKEDAMLYRWFSEEEIACMIAGSENKPDEDVLFILSAEECMRYMPDRKTRCAPLTAYAAQILRSRIGYPAADQGENWCYLTRTMVDEDTIVQIGCDGEQNMTSVRNGDNGIRPAMWIALDTVT